MKRILSTALAIVLFIGVSQAQTGEPGKGHHGGKRGEMLKELNLTADQQARLKSIHEAEAKEMDALKAGGKTDADRAARKAIHDRYRTQMEAVLTTEQKAKLKEGGREFRGDRGQGFGKMTPGRRMGGFGNDLNLSEDQKTKVEGINTEFKSKMEALRGNTTLTDQQRKEQFKQLAEEHHTRLKSVLTPEQVSKMEEKRKGQKDKRNRNL